MTKSQIGGTALLVALAAAAMAVMIAAGPLVWLASIAGLALAMVLLAYDREGHRSVFESLAFSAVFGFCVAVAFAAPLQRAAASQNHPTLFGWPITQDWMALVWAATTLIFWMIDLMRMTGRAPQVARPASSSFSLLSSSAAQVSAKAPNVTAANETAPEVRIERAAEIAQVVPPPVPLTPVSTFLAPTSPATEEEPLPTSAPVSAPAPIPAPASVPQAVPVPAGPETTIYVALVGEGMNVLRAVRAEHVGRDFYKITEQMPEGEIWQYGPGQIVRCKKKNLSSGKALVATEEAPRAS